MKKIKVVSYGNLPVNPPLQLSALAWLVLDKIGASDVVWGIVYTIIGLLWLGWLLRKISEEHVDLFEDRNVA